MVRRPLTVGTRVRVTISLGPYSEPRIWHGVVEGVLDVAGRCSSHPDDRYAYTIVTGTNRVAVFCEFAVRGGLTRT